MTTERLASLPMYDFDRPAVQAWWRTIAAAMRAEGIAQVPADAEWPAELDPHWRDPRLLLSQTCGYPLVTRLRGAVQVVGAFRYGAPGCSGIGYRSELVARAADAGATASLGDFRGRVAVVNEPSSHSGSNALRGVVASLDGVDGVDGVGEFFGSTVVSGSHRRSLECLRHGQADVAAIDCVTLAGLRRHEPALLHGLRAFGATPPAPGLPLITALGTTPQELAGIRRAIAAACADPDAAAQRAALFIAGFEAQEPAAWQPIDDLRQRVERTATAVPQAMR